MEWLYVAAFAAGALFQAVVSFVVAELRTRGEGQRQARRAAAERIRTQKLAALQATTRQVQAFVEWLPVFVAGEETEIRARSARMASLYPEADLLLIGDNQAALLFAEVTNQILGKGRFGGFSPEDAVRLAEMRSAVTTALRVQTELALADQPLRTLDPDAAAALTQARAQADWLVP
jgi:hypothetical protein